jgi:uncharacterized protein YggL (DUF469 family)
MTAPCPSLGFVVVVEPVAGLGEAERDAFQRAWSALLDERGLLAHSRLGAGRSAIIVTSEASQATENDREAARAWLASRSELRHTAVGDLEDLSARRES